MSLIPSKYPEPAFAFTPRRVPSLFGGEKGCVPRIVLTSPKIAGANSEKIVELLTVAPYLTQFQTCKRTCSR